MDLISFRGPTFKGWDDRVAALRLVQKNLCDAALFDPSGTLRLIEPLTCLRSPLLLHSVRGSHYKCWTELCLHGFLIKHGIFTWLLHRSLAERVCVGELQIPQETLYKKNVLLMRGRFRPFTLLHNDMLQGEAAQRCGRSALQSGALLAVCI